MDKKRSNLKTSLGSQSPSPNLGPDNHHQNTKRKRNRQKTNRLINSVKKLRSINKFQLFILTTGLIFSFGGFGFGFALKWGGSLQFSNSNLSTSNQNLSGQLR